MKSGHFSILIKEISLWALVSYISVSHNFLKKKKKIETGGAVVFKMGFAVESLGFAKKMLEISLLFVFKV